MLTEASDTTSATEVEILVDTQLMQRDALPRFNELNTRERLNALYWVAVRHQRPPDQHPAAFLWVYSEEVFRSYAHYIRENPFVPAPLPNRLCVTQYAYFATKQDRLQWVHDWLDDVDKLDQRVDEEVREIKEWRQEVARIIAWVEDALGKAFAACPWTFSEAVVLEGVARLEELYEQPTRRTIHRTVVKDEFICDPHIDDDDCAEEELTGESRMMRKYRGFYTTS